MSQVLQQRLQGTNKHFEKGINLKSEAYKQEKLTMIPLNEHVASYSSTEPNYFIFPFHKMKTDSAIDRVFYFIKYGSESNSAWNS